MVSVWIFLTSSGCLYTLGSPLVTHSTRPVVVVKLLQFAFSQPVTIYGTKAECGYDGVVTLQC